MSTTVFRVSQNGRHVSIHKNYEIDAKAALLQAIEEEFGESDAKNKTVSRYRNTLSCGPFRALTL